MNRRSEVARRSGKPPAGEIRVLYDDINVVCGGRGHGAFAGPSATRQGCPGVAARTTRSASLGIGAVVI